MRAVYIGKGQCRGNQSLSEEEARRNIVLFTYAGHSGVHPGGTIGNMLASSCSFRMSLGEEGEENELSSRGLRLSSVRVHRAAARLCREQYFGLISQHLGQLVR